MPKLLLAVFAFRFVLATILERRWRAYAVDYRAVLGADLATSAFLVFVTFPAAEWFTNRLPNPGWKVVGVVNEWPIIVRVIVYLVVADLGHYWVHRLLHVPALWRFHKWHHVPTHMTWLSGNRESFLDRLLVSLPYIWAWPIIATTPWWVSTALLYFAAFKNDWMHLNVNWRLRALEYVFVTPRFHHIHHSDNPAHFTKNCGSLFSIWDRIFGTHEEPDRAPERLSFGIGERVPLVRLYTGL